MVEYCTRNTETGDIRIHVIEGNVPSSVARNDYELNYGRILGYGTVHDVADITMHFGNKGEKVRQLQEKLIYLGLLDPQYENGVFGNATYDALRAFQLEWDLRPFGWANMSTQKKLDDVCQEKYESTPSTWLVTDDE